ncbi:MAG: cyanophycinase [Planctomycetota bacterium]
MNALRLSLVSLSALLLWLAPACRSTAAAPQAEPTGRLVIAGGAVQDGGPILPAFVRAARQAAELRDQDRPLLAVVPTASADITASIQANETMLNWFGPDLEVRGLRLDSNQPAGSSDAAAVRTLSDAAGVWFTGGNQSRILALFRPQGGGQQPIDQALAANLRAGCVIGGSSAGAAMMSDPMIAGGSSDDALTHGVGPEGVEMAPGMGFYPFGLVDQHFLMRGRMGRLTVALAASGKRFGVGIDEDSAWLVDLALEPVCEAVGVMGVSLLELTHAPIRKDGGSYGLEWSLLGSGDRWYPKEERFEPRAGRVAAPQASGSMAIPERLGDPWQEERLRKAILRLSWDPATPVVLRNETTEVVLRSGPATRFLVDPGNARDLFAERVLVEIRPLQVR